MRSTLGRNLNMCFTGTDESTSFSPGEDLRRPSPTSTTTTTTTTNATSILVKNFNSLFDLTFDNSKSLSHSSDSDSDAGTATTPDFSAVFASRRFFFSSPGLSNSIIDSSSPSSSSRADPAESKAVIGGGVAIPTYSQDPYNDFRRSMQEMVEARDLVDVRSDWPHLHELLTCYLALNPKSTHKFIVRAFSDLLVSLMASAPRKNGGRRSEFSGNGSSVSRRCV